MFSSVSSKRPQRVFGVVGKSVMVGLLAGTTALTQAGVLSNQSAYVDDSCGSANSGARHGGSRGGCTIQLNDQFTESFGDGGTIQGSFTVNVASVAPAVASARPVSSAPLSSVASAKAARSVPAPGAIAPVVSDPVAVVPAAVPTQQIIAAAPPVVPAAQPVTSPTAASGSGNNLPVPSVAVFSVPEPGTMALLLGGFLALVGIRYKRAAAAK